MHHARYYQHFRAWRAWRDAVEEGKEEAVAKRRHERQLKRVKGAAQRLLNSRMSAAWNTWHEMFTQRKRLEKVRPDAPSGNLAA